MLSVLLALFWILPLAEVLVVLALSDWIVQSVYVPSSKIRLAII